MTCERDANFTPDQPMVYEIRVSGHLGREWSGWFDGLAITPGGNGDSLLTGPVVDQSALHGLLKQVRDLGLPLLSVVCLERDEAAAANGDDQVTPGGSDGERPPEVNESR
ncbi:MAG TPA: hypothetical protein VMM78_10170 [Thermomicrobiales bacterium]|nr:hypothetical protein [Thermomicrobiales bacterium]